MANKLINEESPYLQQHANNPVNWLPWGDEAFELASSQNKPIFLSIGYSSCHWCHVMERESFEDEKIAKILNENYVCIKVDKEERPDIDKHFQEVYMKMNNKAGGWPLSIFMTSEKIPIYSGTYIPPIANYGLMGFKDLIEIISKTYNKDLEMLKQKGQEVLNALKPKSKIEATKIDENLLNIATKQIKQVYEKEYGGFGTAPKFPHSYTLNLAINLYKLTKDDELENIVEHTLDNMLVGGIYDIVDGGFCRYSTDKTWLVPHFEKMTYDNALMITTLINAYKISGNELYKEKAKEIADFMLGKMSQDSLFFSASDADTNGVEGEYFTYKYSEVKSAFEEAGIDSSMLSRLSISRNGNFDGKSIPRVIDVKELLNNDIKQAVLILKRLREDREYPFIDKKVITSNSAMMVDALCNLATVEAEYKDIALNALTALEAKMSDGVKLYHSVLIDNKPKVDGFLEDYAWLVKANISAYSVSLDELYLIRATNLANEAVKRYFKDGLWLVSDGEFKDYAEDTDASTPSSVAIMVQNLLTLRSLVEPIYEKFAFKTLEVNSYNIMRQAISRPTMTDAAISYIKDDNIVKSKEENLKELVGYNFKYPYTLLKLTLDDNIEVCSNKACFASFKSVDELKKSM